MMVVIPNGTAVCDQIALWTGRVVANIRGDVVCVMLGVEENDWLVGYKVYPREPGLDGGRYRSCDQPGRTDDVRRRRKDQSDVGQPAMRYPGAVLREAP